MGKLGGVNCWNRSKVFEVECAWGVGCTFGNSRGRTNKWSTFSTGSERVDWDRMILGERVAEYNRLRKWVYSLMYPFKFSRYGRLFAPNNAILFSNNYRISRVENIKIEEVVPSFFDFKSTNNSRFYVLRLTSPFYYPTWYHCWDQQSTSIKVNNYFTRRSQEMKLATASYT